MDLTEDDLIAELVRVHGEGGLAPTAADWRAIFATGREGAVRILNLLAFHETVPTSEGPITGAEAYGRYGRMVAPAFARAGGERIFFGQVGAAFGLDPGPGWDAAILTRYPSALALAEMWLDRDFLAAHENRDAGVRRSEVLVFSE